MDEVMKDLGLPKDRSRADEVSDGWLIPLRDCFRSSSSRARIGAFTKRGTGRIHHRRHIYQGRGLIGLQ